MKGKLIVISGPGGVGKDTLVKEYLKSNDAYLSISATSRKRREYEENNVDYYFLTKNEFEKRIKNNEFLEYAIFNGNYYGTPKSEISEILDSGKNVILILDTKGAFQIKNKIKDSILIFIMPPSKEELKRRISNRGDNEELIQQRLEIAKEEIELSKKYDYIIVNDDLNKTVKDLEKIIND